MASVKTPARPKPYSPVHGPEAGEVLDGAGGAPRARGKAADPRCKLNPGFESTQSPGFESLILLKGRVTVLST